MSTYRLLTEMDTIEDGDELLSDDAEAWKPLAGWEIGMGWNPGFLPIRRRIAGVTVVPAATLKEEFVAELVAGLRRAEEKRKQGIAALPSGTCATCMGEGFLGSIESQRITDCPDCVGGRTRGVQACNFPDCSCDGPMDERCKNNRAAGTKESA